MGMGLIDKSEGKVRWSLLERPRNCSHHPSTTLKFQPKPRKVKVKFLPLSHRREGRNGFLLVSLNLSKSQLFEVDLLGRVK